MSLEPRRGCGYRRLNKLYLVGEGLAMGCHRLPMNIPEVCPVCNSGIKFSRGWTWINPKELFGECEEKDKDYQCHRIDCKICFPPELIGLMFVGLEYTPQSFILEAEQLGVSKAIGTIPKGLELGKTWVYLAHKKGSKKTIEDEKTSTGKKEIVCPAIFYAFRPKRVEMLIKKSDVTEEKLEKLKKRNITHVIVDDDYEKVVKTTEEKEKKEEKELKAKEKFEVLNI